jgi:hypothetical protein
LIDGIVAQFLLADRGYDSNALIDKAIATGCKIVISPIARSCSTTAEAFIVLAILWGIPFCTLSGGEVLQPDMRKHSLSAAVRVRRIDLWLKVLA